MTRIVTAIFGDTQAAERARDNLRALGVPPQRIGLYHPGQVEPATRDAIGSEPGLPALLDALFLPESDAAAHREALRRGHLVVSAEAEPEQVEAVHRAMEEAGAVDFDAAEEGWRREGWSPAVMAGAVSGTSAPAAAMPGTGGLDPMGARRIAEAGRMGGEAATDPAGRDPRHVARREPPIGRARSYVIEAPLAEQRRDS